MSFKKYSDGVLNHIIDYYECSCFSSEHTLKFIIDPDEKELYTEIYLQQPSGFFKRIWKAIKYVFGYKCRYGHFDCFLFKDQDIADLQKLLEEYKRIKNL